MGFSISPQNAHHTTYRRWLWAPVCTAPRCRVLSLRSGAKGPETLPPASGLQSLNPQAKGQGWPASSLLPTHTSCFSRCQRVWARGDRLGRRGV